MNLASPIYSLFLKAVQKARSAFGVSYKEPRKQFLFSIQNRSVQSGTCQA